MIRVRAPQVNLPHIHWKAVVRRWALPAMVGVLLLYTFDQLWNGERGLVTWRLMHEQVRKLEADNAVLRAEVERLERVTGRLKTVAPDGGKKKLDEDFVDEQIRRFLPLKRPGEKILLP